MIERRPWRRVVLVAKHEALSRYVLTLHCGHLVERARQAILERQPPEPAQGSMRRMPH